MSTNCFAQRINEWQPRAREIRLFVANSLTRFPVPKMVARGVRKEEFDVRRISATTFLGYTSHGL